MLPHHARCVLSRLRCNGHSLLLGFIFLGLAELRILPAAPVDIRPRTPLISFCTVQLRTLRRLSVFLRSLVQARESCPTSGAPWSSAMPPSFRKGSDKQQQHDIENIASLASNDKIDIALSTPFNFDDPDDVNGADKTSQVIRTMQVILLELHSDLSLPVID